MYKFAVLCVAAAACGSSSQAPLGGDSDTSGGDSYYHGGDYAAWLQADLDFDGDADGHEDEAAAVFEGTYAQLWITSTIDEVQVVGTVNNSTLALQRVEIELGEEGLLLRSETCSLEIQSSTTMVRTLFPDAFIQALPISERPAQIMPQGNGWYFYAPVFFELRGVELEDPINDALPTDPEDPRIFDQDGDGKPGMTIVIQGILNGEIYIIQRAWSTLAGNEVNPPDFNTLVVWGDEQVILGYSNPLLSNQPSSQQNPDPATQQAHWRAIQPSMNCAEIIAQRSTLFPGHWD